MNRKRSVIVTGSSSGIGKAISDLLLEQGHHVIGVSRQPERQASHEQYTAFAFDLKNIAEMPQMVKAILDSHPAVDALVSNAGIPSMGGLEQWSGVAMSEAIQMNLTSHMALSRYVMPHLRRQAASDIVFMASEAAHKTSKNGAVYCAAKFGLRGFAQALRQEGAASGVRVSTVSPGFVRTPFFNQLDFEPGPEPEHAIAPATVADAVTHILTAAPNVVFDEIRLTPLKHVMTRRVAGIQS